MPATKSNKSLADLKIGILGGGQLARMLTFRGFEAGSEVHVFSESAKDPAAQVTRHWHQGKFASPVELRKFLKQVSVATFESEFMDAELLGRLSAETKTNIYPQPQLMSVIQDRLTQKQLLLTHKLATSEFRKVDTLLDLVRAFDDLGPLVLKQRRFGYDGYGTFVIKRRDELNAVSERIKTNKSGFIAERFIKFRREIACVMVRSLDGSIAALPFVESHQEDSRCLWVKGPLLSPKFRSLQKQLEKFLNRIDYVGAMGFEFFETPRGFLVNELAPRVHNTAHYSMNALSEDQFALHMKAITGAKISSPKTLAKGFAMYNLLGSHSAQPSWTEIPPEVHLHWYGKTENRSGRKMGHLNATGSSADVALKLLKQARKKFKV